MANANGIRKVKSKYPDPPEQTLRPFRLWHAKQKEFLLGKNYKYKARAQIGALIYAKGAQVGVTIEVLDTTTGVWVLVGQYTRRPHAVDIYKEA